MMSFVNIESLRINEMTYKKLSVICEKNIKHMFRLLNDDYLKIEYGMDVRGNFNQKYNHSTDFLLEIVARERLKGKVTNDYKPINWFIDYKSGFSFFPVIYNSLERCNAVVGKKRGVEIKAPWEFGRLYHLVQNAIFSVFEIKFRKRAIIEFKNEFIDFCENNPIGKTVQWSAPMDVSIRMVNLLIAHDILKQISIENEFDYSFEAYFENHIKKSLEYLMEHLEYCGRISANHYLSNLAGVIFASAYLTSDKWVDACLVFGVQELIDQTEKQFYLEGANFEGSTSYHRLSSEFVLYATALIYGVLATQKNEVFFDYDYKKINRLKKKCHQVYKDNELFFPQWYIDRLFRMGCFTEVVQKQNEEIVQVGDNDSGRLLKLSVSGNELMDNDICHSSLLSAMSGLFSGEEFSFWKEKYPLESSFIATMCCGKKINASKFVFPIEKYGVNDYSVKSYRYFKKTTLYRSKRENLLDDLEIYYYQQFGILVYKSKRLFLSVVIDTSEHAVYRGHTHNDKLSIELMVDDKYVTRDVGSYVYTANTEVRNRFRSVRAHNTICVQDIEQNSFNGTFGMDQTCKAKLVYCDQNSIVAMCRYGKVEHLRKIYLSNKEITIVDYSNQKFTVNFCNKLYSKGYGVIRRD